MRPGAAVGMDAIAAADVAGLGPPSGAQQSSAAQPGAAPQPLPERLGQAPPLPEDLKPAPEMDHRERFIRGRMGAVRETIFRTTVLPAKQHAAEELEQMVVGASRILSRNYLASPAGIITSC